MPVTTEDRRLIEYCLTTYRTFLCAYYADAPPDVRDSFIEDLGTFAPVHVRSEEIAQLQARLPAPLPSLFVAYTTTWSVSTMDVGGFLLPAVPDDAPLREVASRLSQDELWFAGYLPFANNINGDPVCFDFLCPTDDGDYPIVVFNHDIVPRDLWGKRAGLLPYAEDIAPSFRTFFTRLCLETERVIKYGLD